MGCSVVLRVPPATDVMVHPVPYFKRDAAVNPRSRKSRELGHPARGRKRVFRVSDYCLMFLVTSYFVYRAAARKFLMSCAGFIFISAICGGSA